ncbi:MAG: hypothetical protein Q9225_003024 [Loekoesia sp. 1 TL-2023]
MEWFPTVSASPPLNGVSRADSRSIRRSRSSRPSSALDSASVSAKNTPLERYQNAVQHPDSAVASSSPFSFSALGRTSKRTVAAPDTPLHHSDTQRVQTNIQRDAGRSTVSSNSVEVPAHLRIPKNNLATLPISPVNHNVTDGSLSGQRLVEKARDIAERTAHERPTETTRPPRAKPNHSPVADFPVGSVGDVSPKDESTASPATKRPSSSTMVPKRAFGASVPLATNLDTMQSSRAWQNDPELAQTTLIRRSAAQWSRAERGEVRKPQLVSEKMFGREHRQINTEGNSELMDRLRSASPPKDPPLYDNFQDKLRQMTVDLWLLRSKIAYSIQDWKAMESHGQQAHALAGVLQWKPFVAKCAFPIGVALYKQRDWLGAYENFEEAEKTQGYYIPRKEILHWLTITNAKLVESAAPWSYGSSAKPGERAPFITPLASVVEEPEEFPFPRPENEAPESETLSTSYQSAQELDSRTEAVEIPASADAPLEHSNPAPLGEACQAPVTEATVSAARGPSLARSVAPCVQDTASVSPTDRFLPPSVRHRRVPAAIRLASNPMPASIGSPRLYDPANPVPSSSPPIRGNSPQLRSGLNTTQLHPTSSLSEMVLPDAAASPDMILDRSRRSASSSDKSGVSGGVPLPDWAIPRRNEPEKGDLQPLKPSSILARKSSSSLGSSQPSERADENEDSTSGSEAPIQPSTTSVLPESASSLTRDFSAPVQNLRSVSPTEASQSLSPLSLISSLRSHTGSQDETDPVISQTPPSEPHLDRPYQNQPALPSSPSSERSPSPEQHTDLGRTQYLSNLRHLHDLESAKIEAAIQNVMAVASPRVRSARSAGILGSPPPPWARPLSAGGGIYAKRPRSRGTMLNRALSERAVPKMEKKVASPSPARRGPRITWGDGWVKGKAAIMEKVMGQKQREADSEEESERESESYDIEEDEEDQGVGDSEEMSPNGESDGDSSEIGDERDERVEEEHVTKGCLQM